MFEKINFLALTLKNSSISGNETLHFSVKAQKIKKPTPRKIYYISGKRSLEKTSYIFSKESFSYISRKKTLKTLLIFQETEAPKKHLIFWEVTFRARKIKKTSSLSLNKNFLYFRRNFQILKIKQKTIL